MTSNQEAAEGRSFASTASFEEQRIAKVYAEALMNAAEKAGKVDEVKAELSELVDKVFETEPDLELILASSAIGKSHKTGLIKKLFENKASELFFSFLMVLNSHERLGIIRSVQHAFLQLDDRRNRRIPVWVCTAVPLSEEQTNHLRDFLKSSFNLEPMLNATVDPGILGGIIIKVADWLFDASVKNRLLEIRKQLIARSSYVIQSRRDHFSPDTGD